jgi:hypothetical protein
MNTLDHQDDIDAMVKGVKIVEKYYQHRHHLLRILNIYPQVKIALQINKFTSFKREV